MSQDVYMTVAEMVAEIRDDVKALSATVGGLEGIPERLTKVEVRVSNLEGTRLILAGVWKTVVLASTVAGTVAALIAAIAFR